MAKDIIEFNTTATDELKRLSTKLSIDRLEVVKNAMALYTLVVDELTKERSRHLGFVLVSSDGDEIEKIVVVPGLSKKGKFRQDMNIQVDRSVRET